MKFLKYASIMLCLLAVLPAITKDKRVRNYEAFYRMLSKAPYSIAVFYSRSKNNMRNESMKDRIEDLETMFRSLSENPLYKDADLQFLRVDLARRDLEQLSTDFSLQTLPAYQLFLGREPIGEQLTGFAYRWQIKKLVHDNLKKQMEQQLKIKAKQRQRELEVAKIRAYNRAYWWGPYGSPYWYWGYYPYWRGPYFRRYWW